MTPSRLYLFIGPSLAGNDVSALCARIPAEVHVLPPIQQGDLLRLPQLDASCVVAIVDGAFFQVPSVTHKEILLALECGAGVLGASSLGALRAAELDVFGMQGVGAIYRLYKRGVIDGDDEVAVLHAEAADGFVPLTEPLVSIRHNLRRARSQGVVSAATAARLLAHAKRLHFTRRTYAAVVEGVGGCAPESELDALRRFLPEEAVDLKRADALALLDLLAARFSGQRRWPDVAPIEVNRTVYAHLFAREYTGRSADGRHVSDAFVLSLYKLLSTSAVRTQRCAVRLALAADEAHHLGVAADAGALVERLRARLHLESEPMLHGWLDEHCLSFDELRAALVERDLQRQLSKRGVRAAQTVSNISARTGLPERMLRKGPRMAPGIPWDGPLLREVKLSGAFRTMLEVARQRLDFSDQMAEQMPGLAESLACSRLEAWAASAWGVRVTGLRRQLIRRGFLNYREFIDVARVAYTYEWLTTPRHSRAAAAP